MTSLLTIYIMTFKKKKTKVPQKSLFFVFVFVLEYICNQEAESKRALWSVVS